MRVLYLSPRESFPPNSGAKLRDFHLARALAQTAEIRYVFFGSAGAAHRLAAELGNAQGVQPPKKYTPLKIARGLMGPQPLPILNYTSGKMQRAIEALHREPFNIIHLDSIHLAGLLPILRRLWPRALITLGWHNIESEGMRRFAASADSFLKRTYAHYTALRLHAAESKMLAELDGHIVCSERERGMLLEREPRARISVVENGVESERFQFSAPEPRPRLVFVGQMSYAPNVDAALWFVNEMWPVLRSRFADLQLDIVGADPTPGVRALSSRPGVNVTGTVLDVRTHYRGALAAVVPLRTGAGTRLKILEAMAAGVPVISTRLGAEGLAVLNRVHLLIAEEPSSWVSAIEWITRTGNAPALRAQARQLIAERYDWRIIGRKLAETYREWCGC